MKQVLLSLCPLYRPGLCSKVTPLAWGHTTSAAGKGSACSAGGPSSIPGSGRSVREGIGYPLQCSWACLVAQLVKNLPEMQETWVWSLGWEDPWRRKRLPTPVFWPVEFHGLSMGSQRVTQLSDFHFHWWSSTCLASEVRAILWNWASLTHGICC